jgi:hypothetical protein
MSHLAKPESVEIFSVDRPFSGFQFAEDRFAGSPPIRKLFSLNRCREGHTLIIEKVPAEGTVKDENEEMAALYPDFRHVDLCRISFWKKAVNEDALGDLTSDDCIGTGESIQYIPSRAWTSNFIVHDDNFGANLCIPQGFLSPENVGHVIELLPQGWAYSGVEAEVSAADYFYSILPHLSQFERLPWMRRLLDYVRTKRLILRHVPISKTDYLKNLGEIDDWDGRKESEETIKLLGTVVAERFWMVEVSIPDVFSTNKRKLGEILLDAEFLISTALDGANFVMARFPGCFVFFESLDESNVPTFSTTPSNLLSHIPLFSVEYT